MSNTIVQHEGPSSREAWDEAEQFRAQWMHRRRFDWRLYYPNSEIRTWPCLFSSVDYDARIVLALSVITPDQEETYIGTRLYL
ncbi:MAG: hypothetical protein Q7V62_14640 [Actinomycetota bacterium]|nr:hypothetical protein [Actinomycetota bacterium]